MELPDLSEHLNALLASMQNAIQTENWDALWQCIPVHASLVQEILQRLPQNTLTPQERQVVKAALQAALVHQNTLAQLTQQHMNGLEQRLHSHSQQRKLEQAYGGHY